MKKVLLLSLLAMLSTSVFASNSAEKFHEYGKNFFIVQGQFFVTPTRVEVRVWNRYNRAIQCNGVAYGQTRQGQVMNSWFNGFIPAYGSGFTYIYSYNPNQYFVRSWGSFNCRFY
jgi:hypothetical protein